MVLAAVDAKAARQQGRAGGDTLGLPRQGRRPQQDAAGPVRPLGHHIDAVMDAVAHIDIELAWLAEQRFVLRGATPVAPSFHRDS